MKSPRKWLVTLTVIILLFGLGWSGHAQKETTSRTTWEYREITGGEHQLNELATQGWELVSAIYDQGAHTRIYILKRAK